jgi:autotransporter-associated beta strand protein
VIEDGNSVGGGPVAFGVSGGTEILTGSNTYSAGTIIGTAGTVQVDNGGTTGTVGVGPVFDNGVLALDRGDAGSTFGNVVSGSGAVSMISSGTTILTGSNSYTGGTIVNAGVLKLGNANAAGAGGPLTVNGGTFDLSGFSESFASLAGTGGVVDNVSAGGNLTLTIGSGNVNTAYAGAIKDSTGSINLVKLGTGTQTLSGANTYTGPTSAQGGELIIGSAAALPAGNKLSISSGAAVQLATVGNTFGLTGLVVNSGGTLDVTANAVALSYSSSDPVASIQSALAAGFASAWAGPGIISSTVASLNASQSALIYSVGYADGKDGITGVPSGEIEILPTLAGDAKLQGNVVFGDFQLLSQYFGDTGTSWDEGNFSYGSSTNFGDFQLLSQNFGQSASALTSGELASINSFAAQFGETMESNGTGYSLVSVPEPASAGLLAAAGFGLLARRRRRSAK